MKQIAAIIGSLILGAVIALGAGVTAGVISINQAPSSATPSSLAQQALDVRLPVQRIIVDARVVPVQSADLGLGTGGIVDQVFVQEGATVGQGQVLLKLHPGIAMTHVAKAQADLTRVQAKLDELRNGVRLGEIQAAQSTIDAAQARLNRIHDSAAIGDVQAAEAALANTQAAYQKILEGASSDQLIEARANLFNAEAERSRAQSAYDQVKWRNDIGALPQSADLQTATNNFEAAQARLADLERGASQADIAAADANVRQAQAKLDALRAALPADIAVAQADLRNAQVQYDLLVQGARPEQIAAAEAEVASATALLQQALIVVAKIELRAPFAGMIASLDINIGEQANAGMPLLRLADTTRWQIETEDLTELQVVNIREGEPVSLTFDALGELTLSGTVRRIRPYGEDSLGDIVYRVIIEPSQQDSRLLWNMTAVAIFE